MAQVVPAALAILTLSNPAWLSEPLSAQWFGAFWPGGDESRQNAVIEINLQPR
jgi:hypothetical protein